MEAIIITKDQFEELLSTVALIHRRVEIITNNSQDTFIDNSEFIRLMKISKRTAQTWRDEKRISYSQIGAKIYYKFADVEKLLNQSTYNPGTKESSKPLLQSTAELPFLSTQNPNPQPLIPSLNEFHPRNLRFPGFARSPAITCCLIRKPGCRCRNCTD